MNSTMPKVGFPRAVLAPLMMPMAMARAIVAIGLFGLHFPALIGEIPGLFRSGALGHPIGDAPKHQRLLKNPDVVQVPLHKEELADLQAWVELGGDDTYSIIVRQK